MKYNWDWGIFFQPAFSGGGIYLDWILSGLKWTVLVSLAAWVIAFTLGSLIGVLRTTPIRPLRLIASGYVELFRNIPLLVQMFLWFFVVPELVPKAWGDWLKTGLPRPEFWTAVVCLGTYTASRVAEQVRSGIQSIPKGQTYAGLAMGLSLPQVYRHVLLPMAYRIIIPPLTSEFLTIFKNSSVALTIGLLELTAQSRQITDFTFHGFEAFTVATLLYVMITMIVMVAMRILEARVRVPGYIGQGSR
ncbi:MAG: glutamate ABC transporter permease [Azospira oryzae]|uniref:Amino acid ABC transporter permease n=1 Tax=Pelomicrobium methylotrophicum TaxID=2602750 RepID=A0A5C7EX18_9PROT|nr:amino acid ABC transporter permease [Pelomicrobium methylotrophicum]PZP50103.1 MAG: glutamate ABC transporter permease [Azospira oryzae]PZP74617.1 MAG: glutamate ABC transporter permease [Azospira oryzae]TXF12835.1 amino acid ABC transporter permease [Pelomicrobium methylotrophicum]